MKDRTEFVREVFCRDRYATELTGVVIEHVGEHTAECSLRVGESHCNARGVAMGGVMFTMGDFAAAVAANVSDERVMSEGPSSLHWVSLDGVVHYLAPAPMGSLLVAKARAIKHGRSTALYQTVIENRDKGHQAVAVVETTMMKVD